MTFLNQYSNKIVKYDLINKFQYNNILDIPKLKYILLNFHLKKGDTKLLIPLISSLKLIVLQDSKIITSKVSNIVFKIRKGHPVGCKLTLRNVKLTKFLFKLLNKILPKSKFNCINKCNNMFSFTLDNSLIFNELEKNYQFFKSLPKLNISVKFDECSIPEFFYLIKSYKLLIN